MRGRGRDGNRQVDLAAGDQRAGAALQRRHARRARSRSTAGRPGTTGPAIWPTSSASSGQNPLASFVTETVEDELAYTMENLGVPADAMRRRVEDAVDLLGLQDLRDRSLRALSGGQQQRVAIGAVLTASPRVLVLDEPTSALDPAAAEEVLNALARLVHDLGLTVVMAEHRLERVRALRRPDRAGARRGAPLVVGPPEVIMRSSTVAPPLVELGRLVGWEPLPLSVRDARRQAAALRERMAPMTPCPSRRRAGADVGGRRGGVAAKGVRALRTGGGARRSVDLDVRPGEVTRAHGEERLGEVDVAQRPVGWSRRRRVARPGWTAPTRTGSSPHDLVRQVGLVPQDPGLLLYGETVSAECHTADQASELEAGTTRARAGAGAARRAGRPPPARPVRGTAPGAGPGHRVGARTALLLLDEPTRGLDYPSKDRLIGVLRELAGTVTP